MSIEALRKAEQVDGFIQALSQGAKLIPIGRGGYVHGSIEEEIKFQQQRHHWLLWAANRNENCIRERIERLEKRIPHEYRYIEQDGVRVSRKGRSMVGVPDDIIMTFAFIEDMELALGGK